MKKVLSLILVVALGAFALVGCDSNSGNSGNSGSADGDTYTVGICQFVQHEALDAATQGFKDALTEKLGDKVTFNEQNASGEASNTTVICSELVSSGVDLILANATPALTAASQATDTIPIIGTSITDYATALGIDADKWTGATGFNVTGTSDLAPLDKQAEMIQELYPNAKTVGILYCSAEANSKFQATEITKYLEKAGLTVKEYTFVDTNDVTAVTQQAVNDNDVIFIPTDNTAASNTEAINNVAEPAGKPIITGEVGICKGCGLATLSISYYDIGHKAGEMAYDILVNGADPATMNIEYATDLTKQYVASRATLLGVTVPDDYEKIAEE